MVLSNPVFFMAEPGFLISGTVSFELRRCWRYFYLLPPNTLKINLGDKLLLSNPKERWF